MHLIQPTNAVAIQPREAGQGLPVFLHVARIITHVIAQIQAVPGRPADATLAGSAQGPHPAWRRPVRAQYVVLSNHSLPVPWHACAGFRSGEPCLLAGALPSSESHRFPGVPVSVAGHAGPGDGTPPAHPATLPLYLWASANARRKPGHSPADGARGSCARGSEIGRAHV